MKSYGFLANKKIRSLFKYSFIKYLAMIIAFVKGILNAKILGPELLGLLGNLLLVLSYLSYTNLGVLYSMNREYVIYESKNDFKGTSKIINTSFTFLLILSIALFLIGILSKLIYKGDTGNYIILIFLLGILEQYKSFYINYFRLINKISMINIIQLIDSLISFLIIIVLIKHYKIYSILISSLISGLIISYFGYKNSKKISLVIDKNILKELIVIGIPLLIYNLGFYILTTVDRIMIIKFLGYNDLGYYTFSNQIVDASLVFISSVLFLYYPKAIKNLNIGTNSIKEVLFRTNQYTKYIESFCVILCLLGVILIWPFVNIIAPQYTISVNIYRILIFGTIIRQISYFANIFIVSNNKQIHLVYLQIISTILAVLLNYIFIQLGMGIIGVSIATLLARSIYSIIQYSIYLRLLNKKRGNIKYVFKVFIKFIIYMVISIVLGFMKINLVLYSFCILFLTFILYFKDFKNTIIEIRSI